MVIDDGVGSTVRERVTATNCDSTQCNYTYYPAVGSRAEFGVSVEVAGCVTTRTVCLERPVCELAANNNNVTISMTLLFFSAIDCVHFVFALT